MVYAVWSWTISRHLEDRSEPSAMIYALEEGVEDRCYPIFFLLRDLSPWYRATLTCRRFEKGIFMKISYLLFFRSSTYTNLSFSRVVSICIRNVLWSYLYNYSTTFLFFALLFIVYFFFSLNLSPWHRRIALLSVVGSTIRFFFTKISDHFFFFITRRTNVYLCLSLHETNRFRNLFDSLRTIKKSYLKFHP